MNEPERYATTSPHLPAVEDEDAPILTEVISPDTAVFQGALPPFNTAQVQELTAEIVASVKQRLSYELSTLLEAVLLNTVEELEADITVSVETAVRDFMEQKFSSEKTDTP